MKEQTLFPPGPATGALTHRQQQVFELLQTNREGLFAIDVGRVLHQRKRPPCGYCSDRSVCQFASRDANQILESLRGSSKDPLARRLVSRKQTGRWIALVRPAEGSGEFPTGF